MSTFVDRYRMQISVAVTIASSVLAVLLMASQAQAQNRSDDAGARRIASWTSDRRAFVVGDVITVFVEEATLASAAETQSGTDVQTRKNGAALTPPKIGTTALPQIDASMNLGKQASSRQNGEASRRLLFRGDLTVRVVAIDEKTGLLQVKGEKKVNVDKNEQTMTFTGWVRAQDVSRTNIVESTRVADAQLEYGLGGKIGKTRGGIIGRILTFVWP
jgi:flagellar L-ring protein precursor FlgH